MTATLVAYSELHWTACLSSSGACQDDTGLRSYMRRKPDGIGIDERPTSARRWDVVFDPDPIAASAGPDSDWAREEKHEAKARRNQADSQHSSFGSLFA